MTDDWLYKLKAAYEAGYYKTESDEDRQSGFPWQSKTCNDCPFWSNNVCHILVEYRRGNAHTCRFFDPWNRDEARRILQERHWEGIRPRRWYRGPDSLP